MVHSAEDGSIPVPDMSALIAQLEAAETGSAELDEAVALACGSKTQGWAEWASDGTFLGSIRLYTTSLDAALALAGRIGFGDCFDIQIRPGTARVSRFADRRAVWMVTPDCATPALALCIAILKAKAQGEGG